MPENAESAGCHCSQGDSFVNNKWYERQNYSYVTFPQFQCPQTNKLKHLGSSLLKGDALMFVYIHYKQLCSLQLVASVSTAAPQWHLVQLVLPDCVHFSCCLDCDHISCCSTIYDYDLHMKISCLVL